ncbi:alpha/beta fold hydrolase [Streptacidiphilus sp. PAMC 29251]
MTLILVHGVPETAAIWEPLRRALGRDDVITLSPPGFGAPVPEGFGATSDDYLAWLVGELEQIEGPIDLVGHDWGGGHVQRVAARRPDLIRSWCSDIAGGTDPAYVWHDLAQLWQTPGVGEETVVSRFGAPVERQVAGLVKGGMTAEAAAASVAAAGPEMGRCILALYRSAAQPALAGWGAELERAERRPALVINATADAYVGGPALAHRAAGRLGAEEAVLEGLGHWWMLQDPQQGAAVLNEFHAGLEKNH